MKHPSETVLALYGTGDVAAWRRPWIGLHVAHCEECRDRLQAYRTDRESIRAFGDEMPLEGRWDRLAAEMAANIRVGLAAGECVAPRGRKHGRSMRWRVTAAVSGFCALLVAAWWLNMPASQTASLGRAMKAVVNGRQWQARRILGFDEGSLVEASAAGIAVRENGGALTLSQRGARPVSVTLNTQGSARARYIDSDTGQVTITSVYEQ